MYRKDFTQLSADELNRLADGFNHLWANGFIQNNATLHDVNFNGGIIHWSPAFLPWHRDFLRKLELELQAFNAQITLPYWDWTRPDSRDLDVGVWKSFFGGRNNTGGRFDHWTYSRSPSPSGSLPTLSDIITELRPNTYFDYRLVESGSHVPGHVWTGGDMASGRSPIDPLFYLHHCNLDRLWAIWQQNNPGATQYTTTIGHPRDINPNANIIGLNESMSVGTNLTPNDVLNHRAMGFLYERDVLLEIAWFESENSQLNTGDPHPADLFIRDSNGDTGVYPSPVPHWASPDIWVRNESPDTPGEDPNDGHQPPIVGQVNYLYVNIANRGTSTATNISVEAFHCNPGTGMLWPDDFNSMGLENLAQNISPAANLRVGPFLWTPTVPDHECLLAIVDAENDPNTLPMFHSSVPHWHLVRFDNSVGQRNVSPVQISLGGEMRSAFRIRGNVSTSDNNLIINAESLPPDTNINIVVPNSILEAAQIINFNEIRRNSRFTTFEIMGGSEGRINGFELKAREDKTIKLAVNFSVLAEHEQLYPLTARQIQNNQLAGELTINLIAIKEREDYVYGNPNSLEMHVIDCPFWHLIAPKNKLPFKDIKDGQIRGYNGCAYCLPEFDTDRNNQ